MMLSNSVWVDFVCGQNVSWSYTVIYFIQSKDKWICNNYLSTVCLFFSLKYSFSSQLKTQKKSSNENDAFASSSWKRERKKERKKNFDYLWCKNWFSNEQNRIHLLICCILLLLSSEYHLFICARICSV